MFEELAKNTPEISLSAKYWFVRTDGGSLYEAFIGTNSIAIGYGMVSLSFIEKLPDDQEFAKDDLKAILKKLYPPKENSEGKTTDLSGLHASQILHFCKNMRRGDIVIVPSTSTQRLGIGFIDDDKAFEEALSYRDQKFPEFSKRRKVRWVRGIDRESINPNLYKLFLNHQAIADASPYAEWVDALLYDFFKKGDDYHFVLRVTTTDDIKAQSLFRACVDLFDLAEGFATTENAKTEFEEINTRINLNSPGDVELWKAGVATIGLIAVLVVFINGGGFELSLGKGTHKISLKTEGLLKRLSEYLNERKRRQNVEEVRKKLANLKVKSPEQIIELLKETRK